MRLLFTNRRSALGIALGVVVAFGGIAAGSAVAALPEFETTLPNSMSISGGEVSLEGGLHVKCKTVSGGASYSSSKSLTSSTLVLKECAEYIGATKLAACTTTGAAEGEIKLNTIALTLAYISKVNHEVGLVLNYGGRESTLATFHCGTLAVTLRGDAIAKITPINTSATSFTLGLKGSAGVQEFLQYEAEGGGIVNTLLEWGTPSFQKLDANVTSLTLTTATAMKVKG